MTSTRLAGSRRLPAGAVVADAIAVALLVLGTVVIVTGPLHVHLSSLRITVNSPWRPYLEAAVVLTLRSWWVRRDPLWARLIRSPLSADERRLFTIGPVGWRAVNSLAAIMLAFGILIAAVTWPQVRRLQSVPDLGDPLFSVWRLAWVAHQLPRAPLHVFDGNIFYPERLTLTYSDPVLVPALMGAPLFWLGVHPLTAYTLVFLSGFALSGVTMFVLVRALTGRRDAAVIAGVVFAMYPYRFEHYSHFELQMTMWMPLVLWGVHRTIARGRLPDGLATGGAFALQTLSSLYYGLFLTVYLIPLGVTLWVGRRCPRRPWRAVCAGMVLAGLMIAPVAAAYLANRQTLVEREPEAVKHYSAERGDYLTPHARSRLYGGWSGNGHPERQLFPGVTPVLLSAVALWPPLGAARIGYTLALLVAYDGSLGANGTVYPWLYRYVAPFRGLRAPARFSLLVGLTLAVLSGYGAARVLRYFARWQILLSSGLLVFVMLDLSPRLQLEPVWRHPPAIYDSLPASPSAVVAEFPRRDDQASYDARYLYFSTFHWYTLVNGTSGFFPPSYYELSRGVRDFPGDAAIRYLRARGVDYVTVHGAFYAPDEYRHIVAVLDTRPDLALASVAGWEGSESRLYRLLRP